MLGLFTLPCLFHLLSLSKIPTMLSCKTSSISVEIHQDWVTTLGSNREQAARMDQVWEGTAVPASKGRKELVGTLIRKAAAMMPPAQEQLLAWLDKANNLKHSLDGPFRPFTILMSLIWTFPNSFLTFLLCGAQGCIQDLR